MTHHIDSRGMVREREQTPAERRATLLQIAAVDDHETAPRHRGLIGGHVPMGTGYEDVAHG